MSKFKLRDYQQDTIDKVIETYNQGKQRQLAVLATGLGKCHTKGTKVLMYNGHYKNVEDLEVGDQLMSPDSTPRNVLSTCKGREKCYKVIPTKGKEWECNESHILHLVGNSRKYKDKTINISVKEYLQTNKTFKHLHKLYRPDGIDFEEKELPIEPYFLGVWLGRELNLFSNKHIPHIYKTGSRQQRLELLAGLIDTDGYLNDGGVNYEITQKSKTLAEDIAFLVRSLGFFTEIKEKKGRIKSRDFEDLYYKLNIIGDTNLIPCRVERKKSNPRKQIKNHLRTGFKLEDIGEKDYYGFTLDGDHLYLLEDFTVTHNTFISTELHKAFKPKEKTIFLVDRIELAYQAQKAFQRSNPDLKVGLEMNKHHAKKTDDIIIACVHTIGRKGSYRIGKFTEKDFTKVIVDEAHMGVSDTYSRVLNYLGVGADNLIEGKLLLGLTATPNRTDGVGLGKVFDEIVVNYDIKYGIKNGWLTDIDIVQIKTGIDLSQVRFTDNRLSELSKHINIDERNLLILKSYVEVGRGGQALIYASTVDHAHAIADLFNKHDIPAFCIEANTDSDERKEAIEKYKKGKIKVLTNYGTLTVGFDAPETSLIIMARPIKSELLLRQIIGRGIRPSKYSFIDVVDTAEKRKRMIGASLKPSCKIIDIYDMMGEHKIVSVPSLFGLNDNLEIPKSQERFYQEVVEKLDELQREKQVDITKITNLDEIDIIVKHERLKVESLKTPEEITDHSSRPWLSVGEDKYEIVYNKDKKTLIVEKNQLDKYDVLEYDYSTKITKKLQEFYDLSSAIKLGDEYADEFFDTTWVDKREEWETKGVTSKQANLLIRLYKGGIRKDKYKRYKDTNVPVLYFRKTGEKLDQGLASNLISQRLSRN